MRFTESVLTNAITCQSKNNFKIKNEFYFLNFRSFKMLGRIYMISSLNSDQVYIGSTIEKLHERFRKHKNSWNQCTSKKIIDKGDAFIELLEEIKVIDEEELRFYENQYLELYKDIAVNKYSSGGGDPKTKQKEYREKHRDIIAKKLKEHYKKKIKIKIECPCGSVVMQLGMHMHLKTQKHQKYLENLAEQ